MTDSNGLAKVNMTIKSCVTFLNHIGRLRIRVNSIEQDIEYANWHKSNYAKHVGLVQRAMAEYLDDFDVVFPQDAALLDAIIKLHDSMSANWPAYLKSDWFVPPPFKSSAVSKLHYSLRYSAFVASMKQRCTSASGKTKYMYYYHPYWSMRSALRKLNSLQPELEYWKSQKPELEKQIITLEATSAELTLDLAYLKSLVDDENLLFSAIPEYHCYCEKVREMFRTMHDTQCAADSVVVRSRASLRYGTGSSAYPLLPVSTHLYAPPARRSLADHEYHASESGARGDCAFRSCRAPPLTRVPDTAMIMNLLADDGLSVFEPFDALEPLPALEPFESGSAYEHDDELSDAAGTPPTPLATPELAKRSQFLELDVI